MNKRIYELRKYYSLSQEKFGEKIGIGKSAVSKIEKGEFVPAERTIKSICREFDVSYAWLVNGDGDKFSNNSSSAAIKDKIDIILEGESEFHKTLIKSIVDMDQHTINEIEKLVKRLYEESQKNK